MILDLTHTITPEIPVYPGTPLPSMQPAFTLEKDHFRETLLSIGSHTGTHMDAPAHLLAEGETLDAMHPSRFCGSAVVWDVSALGADGVITRELLQTREEELRQADFVLFYTGWQEKWGSEAFFAGYPAPDVEAARYLVSCGLKGVGTDAISIDPVGTSLPVHRVLLGAGLVIVENLKMKELAQYPRARFWALPLKYRNADGAPVRAIAEVESEEERNQA